MSWDARSVLRTSLGDGPADRLEFKRDVTPAPDSLHTKFFVGHTRVVAASFTAVLNGEDYDGFTLTQSSGIIETDSAPSGVLLTTYYWQWFTDPELDAMIADSIQQVGVEDVDAVPVGARSSVLELAMAHAFTRKAAEWAEAISASAPDGFSLKVDQVSPNWSKLAQDALARAAKKWEWFVKSPLGLAKPAFSTVSFAMPTYVPRN